VNVNATSFSVTNITASNAGTGFTPGPLSNTGSGNVDGFGKLNLTLKGDDGFTHASDTISFTVTNLSAIWGADTDVLTSNSGGSLAAAHIFVTSFPANASNGASKTGFAANGEQVVPAPPSVVLLGLGGLLALGCLRWRNGCLLRAA